jgi:hypothetical protein
MSIKLSVTESTKQSPFSEFVVKRLLLKIVKKSLLLVSEGRLPRRLFPSKVVQSEWMIDLLQDAPRNDEQRRKMAYVLAIGNMERK